MTHELIKEMAEKYSLDPSIQLGFYYGATWMKMNCPSATRTDAPQTDAETAALREENARLKEAAAKLCVLHSIEQEGLSSVSPKKWVDAVNNLSDVIGADYWAEFHKSNNNGNL